MPHAATREPSDGRSPRRWLTAVVLIALAGVISLPALLAAGRTWVPVEATVVETQVVLRRPGTLEWTLEAEVSYVVDGVEHRGSGLRILSDPDRERVDLKVPEWPAGRTMTVYRDLDRPERISLAADGGLEATVVLTVMFALVACAVSAPFVIAARRARARRGRSGS